LINGATLIDVAREHDLVVWLQHQPGDFTRKGVVPLEAWPAARSCERRGKGAAGDRDPITSKGLWHAGLARWHIHKTFGSRFLHRELKLPRVNSMPPLAVPR